MKSRLIARNVHDAVLHLVEGSCDLLLAYHHPSQPLQLDPDRYEMMSLGHETLVAYAKGVVDRQPMFSLPAAPGRTVPYLAYAPGTYLGRLVEVIAKQSSEPLHLEPIYETDMAEGLKAMTIEGHGLAFLPATSVRKELKSKRLVRAAPPGMHELETDIRICRERPEPARHTRPGAHALWNFLAASSAAATAGSCASCRRA